MISASIPIRACSFAHRVMPSRGQRRFRVLPDRGRLNQVDWSPPSPCDRTNTPGERRPCTRLFAGPGRRGRCRASPPTEPDVRALPHPVPRVSDSLRDVFFAPDPQAPRTMVALAPVWLSAAVALTRVMELRVSSRVSRQRLRTRGAPLPSAGFRWPRFPVFGSTMKALRLPTLHPSGLLFSPFRTKCARV